MIATLHEIEFTHHGYYFLVSGEIDGPTDAPGVVITSLQVELNGELVHATAKTRAGASLLIAAAENMLIDAAEDRRLVFSCDDCGVECYGQPTECPACEDRKEAAIDRARGK